MKDETQTAKAFLFKNFVWVAGLGMAVVNLYLVTKLAPLSQAISNLELRVSANEDRFTSLERTLIAIDTKIELIIGDVGEIKGILRNRE